LMARASCSTASRWTVLRLIQVPVISTTVAGLEF
jgi:hypothetical protein